MPIDESSLEKKALDTIEKERMLSGGEKVVVSVSGGADSVALLLFLRRLATSMDLRLYVFHLDHELRGAESDADAAFVRELAAGQGVEARIDAYDVKKAVEGGRRSPEDAARVVRMERLLAYGEQVGADRVALGHTADDQVETFLMRVIQGAGLDGLGGIPAVRGNLIRPLIHVWRTEVYEYLDLVGSGYRVDSSNMDQSFLRNRIRLTVIPFLQDEFGHSFKGVILRSVESLSWDRRFIQKSQAEAFERVAEVDGEEVRIPVEDLLSLPVSLRRGVIRKAWEYLRPDRPPLLWRHVVDVLDKVAGGGSTARLDLPGGLEAAREYQYLVLRRPAAGRLDGDFLETLQVPGSVRVGSTGFVITAKRVDAEDVEFSRDSSEEYLRPDLTVPLSVRFPREGDRFRPLGSPGRKKLKDFFIDEKVPRKERERCPLVLCEGKIAWVAGRRLGEGFRLRPNDRSAVRLRLVPEQEYHSKPRTKEPPRR